MLETLLPACLAEKPAEYHPYHPGVLKPAWGLPSSRVRCWKHCSLPASQRSRLNLTHTPRREGGVLKPPPLRTSPPPQSSSKGGAEFFFFYHFRVTRAPPKRIAKCLLCEEALDLRRLKPSGKLCSKGRRGPEAPSPSNIPSPTESL